MRRSAALLSSTLLLQTQLVQFTCRRIAAPVQLTPAEGQK
jgi:hypothetical protein